MQGKKNNGKQIFILIICVIAFVITFIIQGKNGRDGNTSLNGVIAQIHIRRIPPVTYLITPAN